MKKVKKFIILFMFGGCLYVMTELAYRKRSHYSMFISGGLGLYLIDLLCNCCNRIKKKSIIIRGIIGSFVITSIELTAGIVFNKKYTVWDYRKVPCNFKGQICLPYSCAWYMLSLPVINIAKLLSKKLEK